MAIIRGAAGALELAAAFYMWRLGRISAALRVNAFLGAIGPLALIGASVFGLGGLVGRLSWGRLVVMAVGIALFLSATRS